jgi:phosphatidylinositol-3-phosphatase
MGSHANNYNNPPHIHPSLPNYLWLEAGTNFGILNAGVSIAQDRQSTTLHLVTLLKSAGIPWKAYDEAADGTVCPIVKWSTAFVFFDDVTNNLDPHSAYCISHIRPLSEMAHDLMNNSPARYNFVVPNKCHSMHTSCTGKNPIAEGDQWLSQIVPEILKSSAYQNGGVLFIVWDEAPMGDGPVPMLVLSPFAKGNGYANSLYYDHGSMLRTIEEIFGVEPLLGDAANQSNLGDLFTAFP